MIRKKLKQYEIFKISVEKLTVVKPKRIEVVPLRLTKKEALKNEEIVKIQNNQLTNSIFEYFEENNIRNFGMDLSNVLCNVYVPQGSKKQGEKRYATLAKRGFTLNEDKFVRLFSGSGQIRRNTITFIRQDLYEPILNRLLCGLTLDDYGKDFNAAKFNAYAGLNMSGCHLLPEELSPNVCVVDDYEAIRPHHIVNHVTEKEVNYIALPDEDFILTDTQTEFEVKEKSAIRKSDGQSFSVHKGIKKSVTEIAYNEIENSPALNSFDGQGLMSPSWAEKVADYLGLNFIPSALIVRAPWVKGLLADVPFHEWFSENGISQIKDSFGKAHDVNDIDVIISKSQFKMHKIYNKKCCAMGVNAWDFHQKSMKENHLRWGITKINAEHDDDCKTLNYQYLQALQLNNDEIEELCKPTEDFLSLLCNGDLETVYNALMVNVANENEDDAEFKKLFQAVIEANAHFLHDKYIRELIAKECKTKFVGAKLGKIICNGNFQFCISDPIAMLEWIASNHCDANMEVKGTVPEAWVYSNYWLNHADHPEEIVMMRSPLIDRNEIAKRKLIKEANHYFRYLSSGIVYSIHDLTALQQGGCDFDGDITFSTNNQIILRGSMDYNSAKPLFYELQSTDLVGRINAINLIKADVRGLNSRVGTISNKSASLYAKLQNYDADSPEHKKIYDGIIANGQVVGMEIDRIKTAVAPTEPLEWKLLQPKKFQSFDGEEVEMNSDDELNGIYRHNDIVPDLKPYFFRYNYDYIDKSLKDLYRNFNKVSELTFGKKLDELIEDCKAGKASEEEQRLYHQLNRAYPVIDSDCIVNHICHYFEKFEKTVKQNAHKDGENMLIGFVQNIFSPDDELYKKAEKLIDEYKRMKQLIAKEAKTTDGDTNKERNLRSYESNKNICCYYRKELLSICDHDLQILFDVLVAVTKQNEKIIFDLMDNLIVEIIRKGMGR